jgi:hypothetical protein
MKTDKNFTQKQRVGVAGSFINQMMGNNNLLPEVGKGATEMHYTDRTCYEVIEVSDDFKTVKLEALDAKIDPEYLALLKGGDCIGHQNWIFEPTGRFATIVWRHGAWRSKCKVVTFTKEFIAKAEQEQVGKYLSYAKSLTPEQHDQVYGDDIRPQNVVPGITREKFEYHKMSIIFGRKDYYYDWSF